MLVERALPLMSLSLTVPGVSLPPPKKKQQNKQKGSV